ncbi:MAG: transcription termination factor Rho [Planctomycetes bacterium]|nr:transcription termination factor Rho [Planctomycetota bacterium]
MSGTVTGVFEPGRQTGGHLRSMDLNYRVRRDDVVVPDKVCRSFGLRGGETVVGSVRTSGTADRSTSPTLAEIERINDNEANEYLDVKPFDGLLPIDPLQALRFETDGGPLSMRVVDLMTPIGLGQRGLIVAAPRTGKTILLQQMAAGVAANFPDIYVMVLLIDERPEEVTDMRRTVRGEVVASSNDEDATNHTRIAKLMIEKAKRLVECGRDVVILLDSLTRLGRAFNVSIRGRGRTMSGGLDARALAEPKAIFGAARNIEGGGSLTILATALIDTGSRMDEVIYNEFKGTGNMEIELSRELANRRVWPAIDLNISGTRKEELLLTEAALAVSHRIRRSLAGKGPERSMELLLEHMGRFPNNEEFISQFSDRFGR